MHDSKIIRAVRHPQSIPGAVLRRLIPSHPRFGYTWIRLPDGSITFQDRGFVAAGSTAELLARHNHEIARIRALLNRQPVHRSLEIGCGFGRLTPTFAEHSECHVAVDINLEALIRAHQAYRGPTFTRGSAISLPFRDGSFDLVTTWTVAQHIPPDQISRACGEIMRVMTPHSTLLMCEETRLAGESVGRKAHTWHRHVDEYGRLLSPLVLAHSGIIEELDRLPSGMSPGTIMVWRTDTQRAGSNSCGGVGTGRRRSS